MPAHHDKIIPISNASLTQRANPNSTALRVTVITKNKKKFEEFRSQLGDGYGMDVRQWSAEQEHHEDEQALVTISTHIMNDSPFSPHFIVREETRLISRDTSDDLTHLPLNELAQKKLESVIHTSVLTVLKPQWEEQKKEGGALEKTLKAFSLRTYEKRSYGYIAPEKQPQCTHGFGWDALFVNAATALTNEQFYALYGKKSARQRTISDFIETYLRYKSLLTLKHHQLALRDPIDFGAHYCSLLQLIKNEPHFSNPHISDWGIDKLRTGVVNEGMFVKGAWSRPVKNYFSPPFSGLPLTAKKDDAEETIFMQHDQLHHLVCDLICDTPPTKTNFYVYSAWRMISEACTLVLADMLYADGLIKSGVARSCVDKRIYPLFEAIKEARQIPEPTQMHQEEKITFIRTLLYANTQYALLGDDRAWKALLTRDDGSIEAKHEVCLTAYKEHFGKFFIGDNAWTSANFKNMYKQGNPLKEWIENIGRAQFRKAHIPLLSDIAAQVTMTDASEYKNVVDVVFNIVFTSRIKHFLSQEFVDFEAENLVQSRAFRRFLMGQASVFFRYPTPVNLDHIKEKILARIKDDTPFSNEEQDRIRNQLKQYILGLEGTGYMSREEQLNAVDCISVFPPVYISYAQMQKQYGSIEECVRQTIERYEIPEKPRVTEAASALSDLSLFAVNQSNSTPVTALSLG